MHGIGAFLDELVQTVDTCPEVTDIHSGDVALGDHIHPTELGQALRTQRLFLPSVVGMAVVWRGEAAEAINGVFARWKHDCENDSMTHFPKRTPQSASDSSFCTIFE